MTRQEAEEIWKETDGNGDLGEYNHQPHHTARTEVNTGINGNNTGDMGIVRDS